MKAVVIRAYGGPEELKFEERPDAIAEPGDVLVRVAATSVNPFDIKLRSGKMNEFFPLTFPAILGVDVAGIVETVGPGVQNLAPGDIVFANAMQTYASLCVVRAADLANIPNRMDIIEAAALPTVTMTGAQLEELATRGRQRGTVLVTGAAGNVGRSAGFAAKQGGWVVIAGVRKKQTEEAKATEADRVIALDDEAAMKSHDRWMRLPTPFPGRAPTSLLAK
jgi:NADPH:quinone reductase-like Zn-dependent oxidoreductase